MQLSLTFLCSALLLPALATAMTNSTINKGGNYTITQVSSTVTSFPTLTPTHSYPNGTNGNSTRSVTSTNNSTATITASESLSTATSLVVVTGSTAASGSATTARATSTQAAAGDAVKKVGNSVGAFAIAMGVLFVGHLL